MQNLASQLSLPLPSKTAPAAARRPACAGTRHDGAAPDRLPLLKEQAHLIGRWLAARLQP